MVEILFLATEIRRGRLPLLKVHWPAVLLTDFGCLTTDISALYKQVYNQLIFLRKICKYKFFVETNDVLNKWCY